MVTLQEYLDKKYPTEKDKESIELICTDDIKKEVGKLEGGKLDLRRYKNLLVLSDSGCHDFVGDDCSSLIIICLSCNNLTNCDFFKSLPCPEKLQRINILP